MESSKPYQTLLLICMLFMSSASPILGCGSCGTPSPVKRHKPKSPPKAPVVQPPVTVPPITVPVPPVTVPPITIPKVPIPPVTLPPVVTIPPIISKPPSSPSPVGTPCPGAPSKETCPIDTLKLSACVDLLGGLVHVGLGEAAKTCCPLLQGLVEVEAAVCLCTTLKIKALNLNIYVPIALQLLVTCGKTPPPGYTCSL